MGDKTINEHYVPQRYLRNFANRFKNKDEWRFFIFDKEQGAPRPGNVDNYASERYFYDVDFKELKKLCEEQNSNLKFDEDIEKAISSVDEQYTEHFFSKNIETDLFKPISNIISTFNLTHPEKLKQIDVFAGESRAAIAVYMTLQWMRTKEFRTGMVQLYEQAPLKMLLKTKLGDDVRNVLENSKLELSDKNYIHFLHNKFIFDNNDTLQEISSDFLTNKIWYVAYNNGVKPFYTSDNPIVKYGHLGQHGIKNRGIEIVFPFNTKLALVLRDRELFCHDIKKDNRYVSIDNDFVDFYNSLQVGQSYRYIFSKTNEFSVAQKMLLRNPNLKNIDRNRFSIN